MSHSSELASEALLLSSTSNECLAHTNRATHTHTHVILTVEAPVESVEDSLQRPAGLSDQSFGLLGAQPGQFLLHVAGAACGTLRTHPQMFTWCSGEDTESLINLIAFH